MRSLLSASLLVSLCAAPVFAQAPKKMIELEDGDLILLKDTARVRVVRRTEGNVRVVHNPQERWVIVLIDQVTPTKAADGRVDQSLVFHDVEGEWPLGPRWEGRATVDEYTIATEMGTVGMGLNAGNGLVQLLSRARGPRDARVLFKDPSAVATVTIAGAGGGSGGNEPFDQAEQRQAAIASRNAGGLPPAGFNTSNSLTFTTNVSGGVAGGAVGGTAAPAQPPPPNAPVRVGGNIRTPTRIQDAEPVMPAVAQQAGVSGVVVLEIIVGPDGNVTSAKVLRSIPLLDAAAVEAAMKWRYQPTLLNGAPVPVIMTATVNFR
jgi:TonB family protein